MRRWLALTGWAAFLGAAVAGLHLLGRWLPLTSIVDPAVPVETALASGLRLVGLGVGYWLAVSTLLYFVGTAGDLPRAMRAVEWVTFGPVRRLVDGIVAGAVAATLGLPAIAGATIGPGYIPVPAGDPVPVDPVRSAPIPADEPVAADEPAAPDLNNPDSTSRWPIPPLRFDAIGEDPSEDQAASGSVSSPAIAAFEATEVVVRAGDHMWALAERRLGILRGRSVSDSEIAPYWLEVVAANLATIRSGDPDLIFPGEVLVLPAVDP
jgi:hypothetical protein